MGPLTNYRIIELGGLGPAPMCGLLLADLGAEVIKVERPGTGDETRQWGPPFAGGESAYYLCCNRNKQSLNLDLKHARGTAIARELAENSDVLIENFRLIGRTKLV